MPGNAGIGRTRAVTILLLMGALFGAAFLFMKVLVDEISPLEIVAGRLALGAAAVLAIIAVRGARFRFGPRAVGKAGALAVLDSIIPFTLVAWAETRIDSGTASVLISTMPAFTVLVASMALPDERLAPVRLLGIPLGFLGVITLSGGDVLDVTSGSAIGQLAVVGAAASYGVSAVYAKVLLKTEDALSLTGTKLACGAALAGLLVFATEGAPGYESLSGQGVAALLALGILSTAVGFTLFIWYVGAAGSVYASLVTYVVPVFGLLLGWAVLGESIGAETALGAGLITLGVATAMYGPKLLPQSRTNERPSREPAPALVAKEEYA
jgi:drug/metabolite transporter (DMT)-like permease